MRMFSNALKQVDKMLADSYADIKNCGDDIERSAYIDYISQLYELRSTITGNYETIDFDALLGSKKAVRQYESLMQSIDKRCVLDYLKHKAFYKEYFGELFDIENELLNDFLSNDLMEFSQLSKEEFFEYVYEFLKKYKLDNLLDRLVENRRLFSIPSYGDGDYLGGCYYNPVNKDTGVALCSFKYNVLCMSVLIHELGHVYDLEHFDYSNPYFNYLKYSYATSNSEIVPIMFEKLFIDFLLEKKYMRNETKDLAINTLLVGRDRMIDAYLLSLLDDKTIIQGPKTVNLKKIFKKLSPYFEVDDGLMDEIEDGDLDPLYTQKYGYGEVVGTILKEEVKAEGFNGRLFSEVLKHRPRLFSPTFIENIASVSTYEKVLTRDVERLKK